MESLRLELAQYDGVNKMTENQKKQKNSVLDRVIVMLYETTAGRLLLRPFVAPWFSKLGCRLLDTRLSGLLVPPFVRRNGIDLSQCETRRFTSYNAFFTRKLRPEARPLDPDPNAWISPCDARLSVWPVTRDGRFVVKRTPYTLEELLRNKQLADHFEGGTLWLYRLCVEDYHRYIYPDDAQKSRNVRISGIFHTVNPIANDNCPIYKENTREYCLLKTKRFGTVLMMEVGAMLVGKIENIESAPAAVCRGEEKGNFAFGGSTILLVTQAGRVIPERTFTACAQAGQEHFVRMGERTGYAGSEFQKQKSM